VSTHLAGPERHRLRPPSSQVRKALASSVDLVRSERSRRDREEREHRARAVSGYDLEHEVEDLVVADEVKGALAALPPEERRAIELAYFGGHTYREVATMLAAPEGTVKSRIRSGLRRMQGSLVDSGIMGRS